jgi:hypothetical protein
MFNASKKLTIAAALAACALAAPGAAQAAWTNAPGTVATTDSQLTGVACVTASNCVLSGLQTGVATRGLLSKWNGSTFTAQTPASTTSEFYGTGCNSSTLCFAVGTDYASGALPHAEKYNGTTWANTTVPTPSGSTFAQLTGVACPGSTSCFAVGSFQNATPSTQPIVDAWNGTSWSAATVTLPSGTTNAELFDVACTSTTACTAVGDYKTTAVPTPRTLVLRYTGTSWTPQTSANPSGTTSAELHGVACTSSTSCQAVGSSVDALGVQNSIAESWNGTTWTLKTVAVPSGALESGLLDVSCSSGTACEAVGSYTSSVGNVEPYAAAWNGTAWSLQTVPKGTGNTDAQLAGVSCPSTCVADGVLVDSSGLLRPAVDLGP